MGDIATKGNKLTKGVKDLVKGTFKGAKKVAQGARDLITAPSKRIKQFGGGRTRLLEELGRVEAEPSNRNRRAEIARVHGELNRGYAKGGRVGLKSGKTPQHYLIHGYGLPKPKKRKAEGGRAGYARGLSVLPKLDKKKWEKQKLAKDTKRGKFPETESLTHQKPPYLGDVGSEGRRAGPRRKGRGLKEQQAPVQKGRRPWGSKTPERVDVKKGGKADKNWIQKAVNPKHKGFCTPITKPGCTGRAKALAKTFKKMARKRKKS